MPLTYIRKFNYFRHLLSFQNYLKLVFNESSISASQSWRIEKYVKMMACHGSFREGGGLCVSRWWSCHLGWRNMLRWGSAMGLLGKGVNSLWRWWPNIRSWFVSCNTTEFAHFCDDLFECVKNYMSTYLVYARMHIIINIFESLDI
jgi:hypothetical protein